MQTLQKASKDECSSSTLNLTGKLPIAQLRMSVGGIDNTLREMRRPSTGEVSGKVWRSSRELLRVDIESTADVLELVGEGSF